MRVGIVGAGKMAEAMLAAWIDTGVLSPDDVCVSDRSDERRRLMRRRYRVKACAQNKPVVEASDLLVLAVKPQDLEAVLQEISAEIDSRHLVLSIAAGKRVGWLEERIPSARVIRVMPNLAALVGEGMSVFCAGTRATREDRQTAVRLLASFGRAMELPEERLDVVTALSGSGPAFFAFFLAGMVSAAEEDGLDREAALVLAGQTMLGTARLLLKKEMDPQDLIASVRSARGTTAAGLEVLETKRVEEAVRDTIRAATTRSRELSRG